MVEKVKGILAKTLTLSLPHKTVSPSSFGQKMLTAVKEGSSQHLNTKKQN